MLALAAVVVACPAFAADSANRDFDVPVGNAVRTLNRYAQQAGCEIMFLPASVDGIETGAVKGEFAPLEALDRMLAGTELVEAQDGQSGIIAVTRRGQPATIVELPPYVVTALGFRSPRWKYATIPGFEILSCCPNSQTQEFMEEVYRQQKCLDEIVPPDLQGRTTMPTTLILFSNEMQQAMFQGMAALAADSARQADKKSTAAGVVLRLSVPALIPQIRLWDDDSSAVDIMVEYRKPGGYDDIGFTPKFLFFLLGRRAPPLPPWFISGILSFYQDLFWSANGAVNPLVYGGKDEFLFPPLWIPPGKPWAPMEIPELQRELPPLQQLFTPPGLPGSPAAEPQRDAAWRAEAALFVRWAFDDETPRRRDALWKLAARAGAGPVTDAMFRGCFGVGLDDMRRQLGDYLPEAMKDGFAWSLTDSTDMPSLEPRDATQAERARILGDWQRMEVDFVRSSHPEYARSYVEQANRTFRRAFMAGEREPQFLAAYGLYLCTVGDDSHARDLLEVAVRAGVVRPSAFVELARIRLAAALARPGGAGGTLSREQTVSVLELLTAIRSQQPPQSMAYELAAEAWEHSSVAPTGAEMAMLDEGIRCFPGNAPLIAASARLRTRLRLK